MGLEFGGAFNDAFWRFEPGRFRRDSTIKYFICLEKMLIKVTD